MKERTLNIIAIAGFILLVFIAVVIARVALNNLTAITTDKFCEDIYKDVVFTCADLKSEFCNETTCTVKAPAINECEIIGKSAFSTCIGKRRESTYGK